MALPDVLPPLRDDIEIFASGASPAGTPSWRLYDPVRNRFFQIGESEFQMLAHWHLGSTRALLDAVAQAMPLAPDESNLEALMLFLHGHQLLARRDRTATAALGTLAPKPQHWAAWLLHNYLFLRIPLANPDRFYTWLAPRLAWLFKPAFWMMVAVLGVVGAAQVLAQSARFASTFSYAFSLEGAVWIALSLALLKSCHEIGHGVAAKRQGLRVTRTGVALLVLWPVLYTDVNDIWKLSDWRARFQVSVAGIATELVFAVGATWGWLLLPEGPLQSAMFIIASTAWVLSLAINLNPFMRFDGYYLLSDLLDYPNLQEASFAAARGTLRRWFGFAEPVLATPGISRRGMAAYGLATFAYRVVLFSGIAYFILLSFPPVLGVPLALIEIGWFIVRPVVSEMLLLWPRRAEITRKRRLALAAAACVLAVMAWIPWSSQVSAPAYLFAARESLFIPASGRVTQVHVRNGDVVQGGQPVLTLESPELSSRLLALEARIREAQARLDKAANNSVTFDQSDVLQQTLAERMVERDSVSAEIARLTIRAQHTSVVRDLASHVVPGRWMKANDRLATLLPANSGTAPQITAYVGENDVQRLAPGAAVRFYPDGDPLTVLHGTVRAVGVGAVTTVGERALTSLSGGPLPSVQTAGGERLHGAFYAVDVTVDPGFAAPQRTMPGTVSVASRAHNPVRDKLRAAMSSLNRYLKF